MKTISLGLILAFGLATMSGCGEQAKPVPNNSGPAIPPQDSGMSAGAPKPGGGEKAIGGRTIGGEKKP